MCKQQAASLLRQKSRHRHTRVGRKTRTLSCLHAQRHGRESSDPPSWRTWHPHANTTTRKGKIPIMAALPTSHLPWYTLVSSHYSHGDGLMVRFQPQAAVAPTRMHSSSHRRDLSQPFYSRHVFIKLVVGMLNLCDDAASTSSHACNGSAFHSMLATHWLADLLSFPGAWIEPCLSLY